MKQRLLVPQCLSALLLAVGLAANSAGAANVIKQDTTTMQSNSTDWSVAPGTGDIGEFDGTISSGNAAGLTLGGSLSIGALQFDGSLKGPVVIGAGGTLTLNNLGTDLDASVANQGVTINSAVALGANQSWNVASGQTLKVGGVVSGGSTLTKSGGGTLMLTNINSVTGDITVAGGTLQISPPIPFNNVLNSISNLTVQSGGTLSMTNRNPVFRTSLIWVQNGGTYTIQGGAPAVGYLQLDTGSTLNFPGPSPGGINVYGQDGARGSASTLVMGSVTVPATSGNGLILFPLGGGPYCTETVQFDGTGTGANISMFILQNGNTTSGGTNAINFNIAHSPSAAVDMNVAVFNTQAGDASRMRIITKLGSGVMAIGGAIPATAVNYNTVVNGGTMIFSNKAPFGSLSVSNGTAQVTAGFGGSTPVTVAATTGGTATLAIAVGGLNTNWACNNLTIDNTLGTSSGLQFNFGPFTPSTTLSPLQVNGTATFTTPPAITISGTSLPATTGNGYPLMTWASGSLTTSGMTLTLPTYYSGSLSIVGNTLYLQINPSAAPVYSWAGGSGIWDTNDLANTIWKDTNSASTYYVDTNVVVLNNTVGSGGTVTLNTIVNPFSVTVTNTTADYTISGNGGIAGFTGLTKSGTGKLTLATTNSYTGVTAINNGTLQIGNGTIDGSIASSFGILDFGTLAFNLTGNQTIPSNQLISGPGNLTKLGNGTLTLAFGSTYTGTTTISGGTLQLSQSVASQALPTNYSSSIIVKNGGTLFITNRASLTRSNLLWLQSGANLTISGSAPSFGYLKLDTGSALNFVNLGGVPGLYLYANDGTTNDLAVMGSVNLPAAAAFGFILDPLTISAANTQTVQFDGTGTGATIAHFTFQNGNTSFGGNNNINFDIAHSPSALVDMNAGELDTQGDSTRVRTITKLGTGIMQVSSNTANSVYYDVVINGGAMIFSNTANFLTMTVNANGTLGGFGPVSDTTVQSGGTISPGTPASPVGTLTLGNLTMSPGATALFQLNKASSPATNDYLITSGQSISGSTLTVSNLGPALAVGDTFTLLSQPTSGFSTVNLPAGYTWTNNLAVDGSIQVLAVTSVTPSPTNISYTLSNSQLVLSWPAGQGWVLQAQTNSLSTGLTTNWFDLTGATAPYTNQINPAKPAVFYRLRY